LLGTVQKVLKPTFSWEPEKAEISVEGADDLYREIRVENVLTDEASMIRYPDNQKREIQRARSDDAPCGRGHANLCSGAQQADYCAHFRIPSCDSMPEEVRSSAHYV